jgi:putative endonuclease
MKPWFLYLIRTRLNSLYTGVSTDVERRFQEHCSGGLKSAKYLRSKTPLQLVYQVRVKNRAQALKVEWRVKKLSKQKKSELVTKNLGTAQLLGFLKI